MAYEVLVWTTFNGEEPILYCPIEELHGTVDTVEKATIFAEDLFLILQDFHPYRYEIIEKRTIMSKQL